MPKTPIVISDDAAREAVRLYSEKNKTYSFRYGEAKFPIDPMDSDKAFEVVAALKAAGKHHPYGLILYVNAFDSGAKDLRPHAMRTLCDELSSNQKLMEIQFIGSCFSAKDMEVLVDFVPRWARASFQSRTPWICSLCFEDCSFSSELTSQFVSMLQRCGSENPLCIFFNARSVTDVDQQFMSQLGAASESVAVVHHAHDVVCGRLDTLEVAWGKKLLETKTVQLSDVEKRLSRQRASYDSVRMFGTGKDEKEVEMAEISSPEFVRCKF